MSDVSKTNEALIAEAQQHYSEMNGLNSRAAEVMMELVAALEAKTGIRVNMSSAVGVETQLAATRAPEQGEASAAIERVRLLAHQHRSAEQHNETVPLSDIGDLIGEPSSAEYFAALDGAPEPEAGTKVVIGKQNRGDDDESWTFTEWEPFELEKAREEFPNSVYEVVTVFGLPVEGESE